MNETVVDISVNVFLKCYRYLFNLTSIFIHFLWGGRDSGKSHFVAQALVKKCLEAKYFRCMLVKETHESIKDAQWQTLKDIIEEWGLSELFIFRKSPLEIECVNGNTFIARGCDEAGKLKSIKDPTDAWIEEGNQISEDDFIVIITTLRSNRANPQIWFSFNPECKGNYEDFWLYKKYFKTRYEKGELSFTDTTNITVTAGEDNEQTILVPVSYSSTHTTYHSNPFCTPLRRALLEQLGKDDPYYYSVFTRGLWGNKKNESPYVHAFDRRKHLGIVKADRKYPLIASFDFNRNPITCLIAQILPGDKLRGIEQIKLPNSDIYKLCDYINQHYGWALWQITGDATGKNSSALVQDNINYYQVIRERLGLGSQQFKVPNTNPIVKENQLLVNAVLQKCDCLFDKDLCSGLTFDFETVSILPTGDIDKSNRDNPAMQADALDCYRYLCNAFLKHISVYDPTKK